MFNYILSILFWFLSYFTFVYYYQDELRANGWIDLRNVPENPAMAGWLVLLTVSIPVFRVLIFISFIGALYITKEQAEEYINSLKNK